MVTPLQRYSDSAPVLTPEGNIGLQSHSLKEFIPAKILETIQPDNHGEDHSFWLSAGRC